MHQAHSPAAQSSAEETLHQKPHTITESTGSESQRSKLESPTVATPLKRAQGPGRQDFDSSSDLLCLALFCDRDELWC